MLPIPSDIIKKIESAKQIELEVEQSYKYKNNRFCFVITLKKDEKVIDDYVMDIDKQILLKIFNDQKNKLKKDIDDIEKQIKKVKSVKKS